MPNHRCPASCGRYFKSIGALNAHLSTAGTCVWYTKAQLNNLDGIIPHPIDREEAEEEEEHIVSGSLQEFDSTFFENILEEDNDDFHFIPQQPLVYGTSDMGANQSEEGPGLQTAAHRIRALTMKRLLDDDDDDERVFDTDPNAGLILQHTTSPRFIPKHNGSDTEMLSEDQDHHFYPFKSEMDWNIARWSVKDSPGQNAMNRLLQVPGVREYHHK